MSHTAFIICSYIKNSFQESLLKKCIESVHSFHPFDSIIILDDTEPTVPFPDVPDYCKIEKTQFHKAGEVNSYVWSILHSDEYDNFVFMQDSTILLNKLPLDTGGLLLRPFFHASMGMFYDIDGDGISEIENRFEFYRENNEKDDFKKLSFNLDWAYFRCHAQGELVFGAMGIWSSKFANILKKMTNFLEIAPLFKTRNHRCYFERLIWVILKQFQDVSTFRSTSICGDIYNHGNAFRIASSIDIKSANNPYIYKIWQNR